MEVSALTKSSVLPWFPGAVGAARDEVVGHVGGGGRGKAGQREGSDGS